jgi:hypothetical protein
MRHPAESSLLSPLAGRRGVPGSFAALAFVLLAVGCAADLREEFPFDGQIASGPLVSAEPGENGVVRLSIDATIKNSQVYVDLDEGREMKADVAFSTNQWDLAFKRYEVFLNGGSGNNTGKVWGLELTGQDFDALTRAPVEGYAQDGTKQVMGGWWDYDAISHRVLTRNDIVYVLISSEGKYFKLKMLGYYDSAGTPAAITLEYAPVLVP